MDGDGDPDHEPEGRAPSERRSDAHPLGNRMDGHHDHDQERPTRILAAERSHADRLIVIEDPLDDEDEHGAGGQPEPEAAQPDPTRLDRQPARGGEHHAGGDGVRPTEHTGTEHG